MHSPVILCPNNGNKDMYVHMYTYAVLMPTAYSMHSTCSGDVVRVNTHTHSGGRLFNISSKFLHIWKTVMLHEEIFHHLNRRPLLSGMLLS